MRNTSTFRSPFTTTVFVFLLTLIGCEDRPSQHIPENQRIEGPFEIIGDWRVISFEPPLVVSRKGYQRLHFVVDENLYMPNSDHDIEDMANHFNLRRRDGELIKPEVILIAADGKEVPVSAISNTSLYEGGLTIGFGTYINHHTASPPYPKAITTFRAAKVRSNEPFKAERLQWWMDIRFPEGAPEPAGERKAISP